MSLRILVDEDLQATELVAMLREKGQDVVTVREAKLLHTRDQEILEKAHGDLRVVLTYNCNDYRALHFSGEPHSGIFVVYQYNNARKEMTYSELVRAIANVEQSGLEIAGNLFQLTSGTLQCLFESSRLTTTCRVHF